MALSSEGAEGFSYDLSVGSPFFPHEASRMQATSSKHSKDKKKRLF
jgi:hypothetical protein